MVDERKYHGFTLALTISLAGGGSIDIGTVQDVSIVVNFTESKLMGAGSLLRQGIKYTEVEVVVTVGIAEIDAELLGEMLNTFVDVTGAGSIADSPDPILFDIIGAVTDEATKDLTITVEDVYFPSIPLLDGKREDWVIWNLEGKGKTVTFIEDP